jgi:hypothetical protein
LRIHFPPDKVNWIKDTEKTMMTASALLRNAIDMVEEKHSQVGSDYFKQYEIERWCNDFGGEKVLRALRYFIANDPLAKSDHPLESFRHYVCELCTRATPLESYAYFKGWLKDARKKELGIGGYPT